jgi:hypothetical protein
MNEIIKENIFRISTQEIVTKLYDLNYLENDSKLLEIYNYYVQLDLAIDCEMADYEDLENDYLELDAKAERILLQYIGYTYNQLMNEREVK